jgi:hypothetical protein
MQRILTFWKINQCTLQLVEEHKFKHPIVHIYRTETGWLIENLPTIHLQTHKCKNLTLSKFKEKKIRHIILKETKVIRTFLGSTSRGSSLRCQYRLFLDPPNLKRPWHLWRSCAAYPCRFAPSTNRCCFISRHHACTRLSLGLLDRKTHYYISGWEAHKMVLGETHWLTDGIC